MAKRYSKKIYICKKKTSKKYEIRQSPPYSAADCQNKIMTGNDNNKWISLRSYETGIYQWKRYTDTVLENRRIRQEKKEKKLIELAKRARKPSKKRRRQSSKIKSKK